MTQFNSSSRAKLNKLLALLEVGKAISLALRRQRPIRSPEINQGLHGLNVLWPQQIKGSGSEDEVTEAAVQLLFQVEVVEGLQEVVPVQMSVDTEHLQENRSADTDEVPGEGAALADPFFRSGGLGAFLRHGCVGDAGVVAGEDGGVVDLAGDPALHESDVLVGRELDGLVAAVEPGVGMVAASRHPGTGGAVADGSAVLALFDDDADEIPEDSVVLNNCRGR